MVLWGTMTLSAHGGDSWRLSEASPVAHITSFSRGAYIASLVVEMFVGQGEMKVPSYFVLVTSVNLASPRFDQVNLLNQPQMTFQRHPERILETLRA